MNNSLRLLFVLNIADIFLTKQLLALGAIELNPIVNFLLSIDFFWALIFKIIVSVVFIQFARGLQGKAKSINSVVVITDVFLGLLVGYQLLGILILS